MKIVKRDGHIVDYDPEKIKVAIQKANTEVRGKEKATERVQQEYLYQIRQGKTNKQALLESLKALSIHLKSIKVKM